MIVRHAVLLAALLLAPASALASCAGLLERLLPGAPLTVAATAETPDGCRFRGVVFDDGATRIEAPRVDLVGADLGDLPGRLPPAMELEIARATVRGDGLNGGAPVPAALELAVRHADGAVTLDALALRLGDGDALAAGGRIEGVGEGLSLDPGDDGARIAALDLALRLDAHIPDLLWPGDGAGPRARAAALAWLLALGQQPGMAEPAAALRAMLADLPDARGTLRLSIGAAGLGAGQLAEMLVRPIPAEVAPALRDAALSATWDAAP